MVRRKRQGLITISMLPCHPLSHTGRALAIVSMVSTVKTHLGGYMYISIYFIKENIKEILWIGWLNTISHI